MRRWACGLLALWPAFVLAQKFEAASIRPAGPNDTVRMWNTDPGRLTVRNLSLKRLVMIALDVQQYQVAGGPKWLDNAARKTTQGSEWLCGTCLRIVSIW
jgi:hypothetical protein